jgi:hypothetical protein
MNNRPVDAAVLRRQSQLIITNLPILVVTSAVHNDLIRLYIIFALLSIYSFVNRVAQLVSIVSSYGLDYRTIEVRSPAEVKVFFL